jgi:oxygen-independent coproporphyrinogen III oxidase
VARRNGRLQRNFQGYSTCLAADLVALGPSAISDVADAYSQNARDLEQYYQLLADDRLPIIGGLRKSFDDRVRHQVIMDIACKLELDFQCIEQIFDIHFHDYFAAELRQLRAQAEDGLLALGDNHLRVSQKGQLLLRNICMVFDAYLGRVPANRIFSRTI